MCNFYHYDVSLNRLHDSLPGVTCSSCASKLCAPCCVLIGDQQCQTTSQRWKSSKPHKFRLDHPTSASVVVCTGHACCRWSQITHGAVGANTLTLNGTPAGDIMEAKSVHQMGTAGCNLTAHGHKYKLKANTSITPPKTTNLTQANMFYLK